MWPHPDFTKIVENQSTIYPLSVEQLPAGEPGDWWLAGNDW
jgi:hypothetical protein